MQILESRLDNIVFRMGLARSRSEARQLVRHGHFEVNGRKVDIPSYQTKVGDEIAVRGKSGSKKIFDYIKEVGEQAGIVDWLESDIKNLRGKIIRVPTREEIDVPISEHLIVEMYSR